MVGFDAQSGMKSASTSIEYPRPAALSALPWLSWACLLMAGVLILQPLAYTWNRNPNYSFGWGIPLVCLFLFYERWSSCPTPKILKVKGTLLAGLMAGGALLLFCFRLVAETDYDWRPVLWGLACLYLVTVFGWLGLCGGVPWIRHFAFPVGFLLLSVPWFFGLEQAVIQVLTRMNTLLAAISLEAGGVDVVVAGNVLHLPHVQLGVEEACSGIISLQASLMMSILLGEIYHLPRKGRLSLIATGIFLALLGNYMRTMALSFAGLSGGESLTEKWHDTAGWGALSFTAAGLWLTAHSWSRIAAGKKTGLAARKVTSSPVSRSLTVPKKAQFLAVGVLFAAIVSTLATEAWFGGRESQMTRHPMWTPSFQSLPSFQKVNLSPTTFRLLDCDFSQTGHWTDPAGWHWIGYWFRYLPKPYMTVSEHNPSTCLPSSGFTMEEAYPSFSTEANGLHLEVQPLRFAPQDQKASIYVFWVVYIASGDESMIQPVTGLGKIGLKLKEVWAGYRGVEYETLEVAITGPHNYLEAKAGYVEALKTLVLPLQTP